MKKNLHKIQTKGLQNRSDEQQLQTTHPQPTRILPYVNREERNRNRALTTDVLLRLLCRLMPEEYSLAEIIGAWVWITFPDPPSEQIRSQLSQLGFDWNNLRKCWQHPCGQFTTEPSTRDPRQKYGTRPAAQTNH